MPPAPILMLEVPAAILTDPSINERQKQVLIQIYESFRKENAGAGQAGGPEGPAAEADEKANEDGTGAGGRGAAGDPVREEDET